MKLLLSKKTLKNIGVFYGGFTYQKAEDQRDGNKRDKEYQIEKDKINALFGCTR